MTSDTAVLVRREEIPENTSGIVSHEFNGDCHCTFSMAEDLVPVCGTLVFYGSMLQIAALYNHFV